MLDVSEKKEIREIIKDEMNKLLINPLMILAQGIADIKSEVISLADSKIHRP